MDYLTFIILLIALFQSGKIVRYLYNAGQHMKTLMPSQIVTNNVISIVAPVTSDNYIPSTDEEQTMLLDLEKILKLKPKRLQDDSYSSVKRSANADADTTVDFLPATNISELSMVQVSKMIVCSAGLQKSGFLCKDIHEFRKNELYGFKTKKSLIFGFRLRLEDVPMSAAHLRIKLHHRMNSHCWPLILNEIRKRENVGREILFVGYETGGSLASLAAWLAVKELSSTTKTSKILTTSLSSTSTTTMTTTRSLTSSIISNSDNRVKVITWDELPLFTKSTAKESPLLPHNHLRFSTFECHDSHFISIAKASGGTNEIGYFSTSGQVLNIPGTVYNDFAYRTKTDSWNARSALVNFISAKNFSKLDESRTQKLMNVLELHRRHLAILSELIQNRHQEYINNAVLVEPNACAAALAHQLSSEVFPGTSISCRVDSFEPSEETFQLFCSYKSADGKSTSQFLSFDAILGDESANQAQNNCLPFMHDFYEEEEEENAEVEEVESKTTSANLTNNANYVKPHRRLVKRYVGPELVTNSWGKCLYHLFEQSPGLSIVSPFAVKNKYVRPQCSYVPFGTFLPSKSGTKNTGCYLRALDVANELSQLRQSDPALFYRMVDPKVMKFPAECRDNLFHISYKATDRPDLLKLQQLAVDYLTERISHNPLASKEVTLWRPKDTASFKSLSYFGKNIAEELLFDPENYHYNYTNSLTKCLSNASYPYRDCTDPLNLWVPRACPAACKLFSGPDSFLCKQVKNCLVAGYYVAVSRDGTEQQLRDAQAKMTAEYPQFGLFKIQKKPTSSYSLNLDLFYIGLFRIPEE